MNPLPQVVPISDMRNNYATVVAMLDNGPVVLTARGRPTGVFVSPNEWDAMAHELARLRHLEQCDRIISEMDSDPSKEIILTGDQLVELHRVA